MERTLPKYLTPPGYLADMGIIADFEQRLDIRNPDDNPIPCKILGYGEISTVLMLEVPELEGLALKRVSVFRAEDELLSYLATYLEYNDLLEHSVGLSLPAHGYCIVLSPAGRPILYLIQEQLPSEGIGNKLIDTIDDENSVLLFREILRELDKVWLYNQTHQNKQVAIDGQLSNWCLPSAGTWESFPESPLILQYIDTSTPQILLDGVEQLDGNLFLRSAPPVLDRLLQILYMDEVMSRYYDPFNVITDLIANFYKEQRPELIPALIEAGNQTLANNPYFDDNRRFDAEAIQSYYKRDSWIWRLYMNSRRIDRFVRHDILKMDYPYIIPPRVKR